MTKKQTKTGQNEMIEVKTTRHEIIFINNKNSQLFNYLVVNSLYQCFYKSLSEKFIFIYIYLNNFYNFCCF